MMMMKKRKKLAAATAVVDDDSLNPTATKTTNKQTTQKKKKKKKSTNFAFAKQQQQILFPIPPRPTQHNKILQTKFQIQQKHTYPPHPPTKTAASTPIHTYKCTYTHTYNTYIHT